MVVFFRCVKNLVDMIMEKIESKVCYSFLLKYFYESIVYYKYKCSVRFKKEWVEEVEVNFLEWEKIEMLNINIKWVFEEYFMIEGKIIEDF